MIKKICFMIMCLMLGAKNAGAWSISVPPETKILSERLTECESFEYTMKNLFDVKLLIQGREGEWCSVSLDLVDLRDEKKQKTQHYECKISDFNIEEVKLAFEQATVKVVDLNKDKDDSVILELFEGFKKNNICH